MIPSCSTLDAESQTRRRQSWLDWRYDGAGLMLRTECYCHVVAITFSRRTSALSELACCRADFSISTVPEGSGKVERKRISDRERRLNEAFQNTCTSERVFDHGQSKGTRVRCQGFPNEKSPSEIPRDEAADDPRPNTCLTSGANIRTLQP